MEVMQDLLMVGVLVVVEVDTTVVHLVPLQLIIQMDIQEEGVVVHHMLMK